MKRKAIIIAAIAAVVLLLGVYTAFAPMLKGKETAYVYVDNNDTKDSVATQLSHIAHWPQRWGVSLMAALTNYDKHPLTVDTHCSRAKVHSSFSVLCAADISLPWS